MPFSRTIEAFAQALADPARPPPSQTMGREGAADARRFAVYRNNIAASLIGALAARYPVTQRLVGEAFFRAMAGAFVAEAKPRSPVILHYGADFPDYIARFRARPRDRLSRRRGAARKRLGGGLSRGGGRTAGGREAGRGRHRTCWRFAVRIPSGSPAPGLGPSGRLDLGRPSGRGRAAGAQHWRGEEILVARPGADVEVRVLPADGYAFALALQRGRTLGQAHAAVTSDDFDPGAHLVGLMEAGAISRLRF